VGKGVVRNIERQKKMRKGDRGRERVEEGGGERELERVIRG
jgi:hypothetical protein